MKLSKLFSAPIKEIGKTKAQCDALSQVLNRLAAKTAKSINQTRLLSTQFSTNKRTHEIP